MCIFWYHQGCNTHFLVGYVHFVSWKTWHMNYCLKLYLGTTGFQATTYPAHFITFCSSVFKYIWMFWFNVKGIGLSRSISRLWKTEHMSYVLEMTKEADVRAKIGDRNWENKVQLWVNSLILCLSHLKGNGMQLCIKQLIHKHVMY